MSQHFLNGDTPATITPQLDKHGCNIAAGEIHVTYKQLIAAIGPGILPAYSYCATFTVAPH